MACPPVYDKLIMRLKPSRQAGACSRARRSARQRPSPRFRAAPPGAWAASRLVQYRRFQHWRDDGGSSSARLATDGRWHPPMSRPPRPASRAQLIGRFIADTNADFDARVWPRRAGDAWYLVHLPAQCLWVSSVIIGGTDDTPGPNLFTCQCRGQGYGLSSHEAVAAAATFHRHDPPGWGYTHTHMMGVHDAVREQGGGVPLHHPLSRQGQAGKQQPQQLQRLTGSSRCGHRQPSRMHAAGAAPCHHASASWRGMHQASPHAEAGHGLSACLR